LLEDRRDFLVVQRVLQTVSQDQAQREAFARLVRTCSRVEGKKNEIIRVSLCSVIKASRKKNLHERRETRKRSPKDGSRRAQSAIASRTVFRTTPMF
jgi:hypothetical protein